jgi:hypothetical protein
VSLCGKPRIRRSIERDAADVALPAETARVLRAALERRLELVEARLAHGGAERPRLPPAEDPEETLRELMVRLWPRVRDGRASDAERVRFRRSLGSLWEPALGADLRFLDAWNNAFETAAAELDHSLLTAYADLLRAHVRRLGVERAPLDPAARPDE